MTTDKAWRLWISHECRGVSPRWVIDDHTSPRFPAYSTPGIPESRASIVIRRRVLSVFNRRRNLLATKPSREPPHGTF
jgi:hypothetical protein